MEVWWRKRKEEMEMGEERRKEKRFGFHFGGKDSTYADQSVTHFHDEARPTYRNT